MVSQASLLSRAFLSPESWGSPIPGSLVPILRFPLGSPSLLHFGVGGYEFAEQVMPVARSPGAKGFPFSFLLDPALVGARVFPLGPLEFLGL